MRILIDATPLLLRSAGVKTYTYHWIQHLFEEARNEQILTFPKLDNFAALNHERSMLSPGRTFYQLGMLYAANVLEAVPLLGLDYPESGCVPRFQSGPESAQENSSSPRPSMT